jgi:hypothetical protein
LIKLISALATSRDYVDRAIAFGEAVPRLERLRTVVIAGLMGACFILAAGYIHLTQEMETIQTQQRQAARERVAILKSMGDLREQNEALTLLLGKSRASSPSTP